MMAVLYSKATVARNLSAVAIILSLSFSAFSQTKNTLRISCSFSSAKFEHIINFLSMSAGVDFVYSSSKIRVSQPVSLFANNKSLDDVLAGLGKELNLDFKIEGRHVVIKTTGVKKEELSNVIASSKKFFVPAIVAKQQFVDTIEISDVNNRVNPFAAIEENSLQSSDEYFRKHVSKFQSYFDTTKLMHIPTRYIRALNKNSFHAGWFVSAGVLVNDYSSGLELQAGIRNVYAVFSPAWIRRTGEFHGAYGLGTSFNLTHDFSANVIYTFASVKRVANDYFEYGNSNTGVLVYNQKIDHHQMKVMLQYSLNRRFAIKTGVTFNQTTTNYLEVIPKEQIVRSQPAMRGGYGNPKPGGYEQRVEVLTLQKQKVSNFWVGWEAGISYKLNLQLK